MKQVACWLMVFALLLSPMAAMPECSAKEAAGATPGIDKVTYDKTSDIAEYRLKSNGLQVILAERHATPIVTVMIVYRVGSRNEAVGYTGSTHFLEHMMFRGTAKHDPLKGTGIDDILKPIGGNNNATTYYDRTYYYEVVPAQYLGTCLELEADRMRNALLRESDQKAEMTVVRNELERNEDDPGRLLDIKLFALAFLEHPYHHPVIGWRSDVENVPIQRLRKFYNDFYYPNNASLIVIGDFQSSSALSLVSKYFGHLLKAPSAFPKVYTVEPPQEGQRRFVVTRGESLPRVAIGYHIPKTTSTDTFALEVAASILGDEKRQSSRLYKALIDSGLASETYAANYSLADPALFAMTATATPGTKNEKLEKVLFDQAEKLAKEPVSDAELQKAKQAVWKHMKLEAADPTGMASQLAESIAVADWKFWLNFEKNIKAVTKQDIQKVAEKYFLKRNETVGYYYPSKPADKDTATSPGESDSSPADAGSTPAAPPADAPQEHSSGLLDNPAEPASIRSVLSVPEFVGAMPCIARLGPQSQIAAALPSEDRHARSFSSAKGTNTTSIASQVRKQVLPNGLTVVVMPIKDCGVVAVAGKIKAGDYFRSPDRACLPDLVADMLDKGSAKYSKEKLAEQLELMGTGLDFESGNFWMTFNSDVVSEDLPNFLDILSDTLKQPRFAEDELGKCKTQQKAAITAAMSDANEVSSNALYGSIYKPECVYYAPPFKAQLEELPKVTTDNLKQFHQAHITPANSVLAVVGDIGFEQAFDLVKKYFGDWQGGAADKINVDDCGTANITSRRIVTQLADKTNVEVLMGAPKAISLKSSDFYAASLANSALGHDTISSRLAELRNKYGYTYGVSSYFGENGFPNGLWLIDLSVNPENLDKALPLVNRILTDYRKTGMTPGELSDEANRLAGEFIVERMRTPHQLAEALTKYEFLGLGAKFMDDYPVLLKAVTLAQANAAIKKYFDPAHLVTSIAGSVSTEKKTEKK
jgi:zinc protease